MHHLKYIDYHILDCAAGFGYISHQGPGSRVLRGSSTAHGDCITRRGSIRISWLSFGTHTPSLFVRRAPVKGVMQPSVSATPTTCDQGAEPITGSGRGTESEPRLSVLLRDSFGRTPTAAISTTVEPPLDGDLIYSSTWVPNPSPLPVLQLQRWWHGSSSYLAPVRVRQSADGKNLSGHVPEGNHRSTRRYTNTIP